MANATDRLASMISGLQSAGLSRSDIALRAAIGRSTVWRAAEGLIRHPSVETYERVAGLCQRVGVDVTRDQRR